MCRVRPFSFLGNIIIVMRIKDITNSIDFGLTEEDSILEASKHMKSQRIRSLPVVDMNNKFVGLITLREIIDSIVSNNKTKVKEAMLRSVVSITPDLPIKAAVKIMMVNRYGCLPVKDNDENLVGFLAEIDFLRPMVKMLKESNNGQINLTVKDVMNPEPNTLKENDNVIESSSFMKGEKVRALPVVGMFNKIVGLVTLREIIDALVNNDQTLLIKDAMLKEAQVITVTPETSLEEAVEIMCTNKFNSLPVADKGKTLKGMVTDTDLFRNLNKLIKVPDDFYSERFRI